uniref:Uncharacterized protein n=1 Tax=Romanomermis culicivorax TaxID=13658 RepID=A0A915JPE7_ROMCU
MGTHLRNDFPQHASTSATTAHHQNVFQQSPLTSASGAHLQITPHQGASTSAVGARHQKVFPRGAMISTMDCHQNNFLHYGMTSARCADHQNASPRGAVTSARDGNDQYVSPQGAVTSARGGDDQYAFPRGAVTSAMFADHHIAFPQEAATSATITHQPTTISDVPQPAVPEAMTLQSSTSPPMNKCFDCPHSHDHPMNRRRAELPAAFGRSHLSDGSPSEGTNLPFQHQIALYADKESHKSRAISTKENDHLEQQNCYKSHSRDRYQTGNRQSAIYDLNWFPPTPSSDLWCNTHNSRTHNTKDCHWLKQVNTLKMYHQNPDPPMMPYTSQYLNPNQHHYSND